MHVRDYESRWALDSVSRGFKQYHKLILVVHVHAHVVGMEQIPDGYLVSGCTAYYTNMYI